MSEQLEHSELLSLNLYRVDLLEVRLLVLRNLLNETLLERFMLALVKVFLFCRCLLVHLAFQACSFLDHALKQSVLLSTSDSVHVGEIKLSVSITFGLTLALFAKVSVLEAHHSRPVWLVVI